jgi:protein transport protein HofC
VELPEVTILVIRASHVVIEYSWVLTLLTLGLLIYFMAGLFGWGDMSIPLFDRLFVRRHTSLILRSLAVVVSAGRPIPPALYSLAQWYPTRWVRKKLGHASVDANQGVDWTEALYSSGLLFSSDLGVLTSASRAGNLAWALRELAETGERRWAYRLQAWTQFLFALAMVVLGGLVFLLAVAYFAPLTTLITRLAR